MPGRVEQRTCREEAPDLQQCLGGQRGCGADERCQRKRQAWPCPRCVPTGCSLCWAHSACSELEGRGSGAAWGAAGETWERTVWGWASGLPSSAV